MDQSINIDHSIKEEIKEELKTEDNVDDTFPHYAGNLQNNETDSIKSEIDIVENLEIDAEMLNGDSVMDIDREIANCIKTEQEDITDIKSESKFLMEKSMSNLFIKESNTVVSFVNTRQLRNGYFKNI